MKKLRMFSIVLLLVSTVVFVVFHIYIRIVQDNVPPVVTCATEEIIVGVNAPEEELFQGVTAKDARSGDVTDTLVIEEMSGFTDEGTRIITYAAVDESKNVGRCERTLKYKGYEPPQFTLNAPLSFIVGRDVSIEGIFGAQSVLDGDISPYVKYTLEETVNSMEEGTYPIEFRVMDSCGKNVYLKTEIEIYGRDYMGIQVTLKEYIVYLDKGASFNAANYFEKSDYAGNLSIQSNVNTNEEGVYHVDYIVNDGNRKGKSRLLVVVQ